MNSPILLINHLYHHLFPFLFFYLSLGGLCVDIFSVFLGPFSFCISGSNCVFSSFDVATIGELWMGFGWERLNGIGIGLLFALCTYLLF
jgi:hypothetical protein